MFTRKLFTLTAVAGLSLSLAACGDDSGNSDATATETTVVTSDDATTEETTTAEETTDTAGKGCGSTLGLGVCLAALLPAVAFCFGSKRKRD